MVGFGSALRMSRREGWERAYFDYESLKLMLTQIETIYEESDTAAAAVQDLEWTVGQHGVFVSEEAGSVEGAMTKTLDYRDQLFLIEASDDAFASDSDEGGDMLEGNVNADGSVVSNDREFFQGKGRVLG